MKNILVFAAHPDNELLGEGGTIRCLVDKGACARAVIMAEGLTSRGDAREDIDKDALIALQRDAYAASKKIGYASIDFCGLPDNRMDKLDLLDVVKIVSSFVEKYNPDTVFTHHHGDLNIDHRITCEAVLTACRPIKTCNVRRIYAFETPSSTEWGVPYSEPFMPNVFFDVTNTFEAKIQGIECYKTEKTEYPHPRSADALRALGKYRGTNVNCEMAEGFMLLREVVSLEKVSYSQQ